MDQGAASPPSSAPSSTPFSSAEEVAWFWYSVVRETVAAIVDRYQLSTLRWVAVAIAVMPLLFATQRVILLLHGTIRFAIRIAESACVSGLVLAFVAVGVRWAEASRLIGAVAPEMHELLVDARTVAILTASVFIIRILQEHLCGVGQRSATGRARGSGNNGTTGSGRTESIEDLD